MRADLYQATADDFARNIKTWTVTTNGPDAPCPLLHPALQDRGPERGDHVYLGNGSPTVDQRCHRRRLPRARPAGILPADDPDVRRRCLVDKTSSARPRAASGFYRYGTSPTESADGYGDCYQPSETSCTTVGAPWPPTDTGTGHLWPVLTASAASTTSPRVMLSAQPAPIDAQHDVRPGPRARAGLGGPRCRPRPTAPIRRPRRSASDGSPPVRPARSPGLRRSTRGSRSISRRPQPGDAVDRHRALRQERDARPAAGNDHLADARLERQHLDGHGHRDHHAGRDRRREAVGSAGGTAAIASATADSSGNWSLTIPASFG